MGSTLAGRRRRVRARVVASDSAALQHAAGDSGRWRGKRAGRVRAEQPGGLAPWASGHQAWKDQESRRQAKSWLPGTAAVCCARNLTLLAAIACLPAPSVPVSVPVRTAATPCQACVRLPLPSPFLRVGMGRSGTGERTSSVREPVCTCCASLTLPPQGLSEPCLARLSSQVLYCCSERDLARYRAPR
jgi:hypothetical protein